ncbi:MAG: 3-phenylpropionate/trans-cinnamate dioxygenase ferredoxin reductase subunit [Pseudohongiellaceae bacterium]|jgi:3-phenylpropionate/trans-cinnamate dioxygenase ferredoxin reductase subunit
METNRCVIVGASHAGVTLALSLRKEGWQGEIVLIGAESQLPYHRPPLSKDFLAGEKDFETMLLRPEKAFSDNNIELILGTRVDGIDAASQTVTLSDGKEIAYAKLALCTGAEAIQLPMAKGLAGVHTIRSVADVLPIKESLHKVKKAVIVGAGYVGLEVAAVLAKAGVEVNVLEMAERILSRVTSVTMSNYMQALHEKHGVTIHTGIRVTSFIGDGKVEAVSCITGETFEADLVVIGVGVTPASILAIAAGAAVENGIVVNGKCETSVNNIYAAGDCTSHPSPLYSRFLRLESVQNANDQGRIAAAAICGKDKEYDAVPWFWSDQYDIKLQMVGLSHDFDKVVIRGDATDAHSLGFSLFYFKDDTLIAADCVSRPKEFMAAKQLVQRRAKIDPAILMDEAIEPASFLV